MCVALPTPTFHFLKRGATPNYLGHPALSMQTGWGYPGSSSKTGNSSADVETCALFLVRPPWRLPSVQAAPIDLLAL
jgi:hypothetical protein